MTSDRDPPALPALHYPEPGADPAHDPGIVMRRRGMLLECAMKGAFRMAVFLRLIGSVFQVQAGMDWAKREVAAERVRDSGDKEKPCKQPPAVF